MLGISLVSDSGRYIYKDLQAATYNGQAVNLSLWLRNNVGLESNGSKWAD